MYVYRRPFRIVARRLWIGTVAVGAPVVVTPPTATLTLTTFAPTVSTPRLVTPPVLALSLNTFAPTISTPRIVIPSILVLTLTTFAPTVSTPRLITPPILALTLTTFAPTVTTPIIATPGVLALNLATFAPTVSVTNNVTVTPPILVLNLITFAPTVTVPAPPTPARGGGGLAAVPQLPGKVRQPAVPRLVYLTPAPTISLATITIKISLYISFSIELIFREKTLVVLGLLMSCHIAAGMLFIGNGGDPYILCEKEDQKILGLSEDLEDEESLLEVF